MVKYLRQNNGCVYTAVDQDEFSVTFRCIECKEQLTLFKGYPLINTIGCLRKSSWPTKGIFRQFPYNDMKSFYNIHQRKKKSERREARLETKTEDLFKGNYQKPKPTRRKF